MYPTSSHPSLFLAIVNCYSFTVLFNMQVKKVKTSLEKKKAVHEEIQAELSLSWPAILGGLYFSSNG